MGTLFWVPIVTQRYEIGSGHATADFKTAVILLLLLETFLPVL